jgi:hypothetical protein
MTTWALVWLLIYGLATLVFFSVAFVITFYGFRDLRDLLNKSHRKDKNKFSEISGLDRK